MKFFQRDDGTKIQVVPGFRERTLAYRRAVSPREHWTEEDYAAATAKKRKRFQRILEKAASFGFELSGRSVLDVGCGDGSNCLLFGVSGAGHVHGIDLSLPLFAETEKGERARRVASKLIAARSAEELSREIVRLGVVFENMDATRMSFVDGSFDFVMSRSAMEHVRPVEAALREIVRVTKPGGLICLSIDPFYWLRGCHKRGVVDIPWAHARLTLPEYSRFVSLYEDDARAAQRHERLETLNRLTLADWRASIEAVACEVLEWTEDLSEMGQEELKQHSEVASTLLPGVTQRDLLRERIRVWLRRPLG
jgi:ubiquinone/menaquinone biosynthesis C-methylase UbiE